MALFNLVKGMISTKIGLSNGTILTLWAAHSYPGFSLATPPLGWEQKDPNNYKNSEFESFAFWIFLQNPGDPKDLV